MKNRKFIIAFLLIITSITSVSAAEYKIDTDGMHASVNFKISHLGTSWLVGRFDKFEGTYSYDAEKPNESSVQMTVETSSVNTNHAERNSHIRAENLLNTDNFPIATFVSDSVVFEDDINGIVKGKLKLHGVEKEVSMDIVKVGEGKDPWGGYRTGFEGTMTLRLADFGITRNLGKASETLELTVMLEGIRQ
ncbi:MAG: YceI family protein [Xanthomonadales bacterium]|nr:YceI family protein [Xanthomonadales bacterium]